jgi:hypothetical protein
VTASLVVEPNDSIVYAAEDKTRKPMTVRLRWDDHPRLSLDWSCVCLCVCLSVCVCVCQEDDMPWVFHNRGPYQLECIDKWMPLWVPDATFSHFLCMVQPVGLERAAMT